MRDVAIFSCFPRRSAGLGGATMGIFQAVQGKGLARSITP